MLRADYDAIEEAPQTLGTRTPRPGSTVSDKSPADWCISLWSRTTTRGEVMVQADRWPVVRPEELTSLLARLQAGGADHPVMTTARGSQ
jgi:hypothetical protein